MSLFRPVLVGALGVALAAAPSGLVGAAPCWRPPVVAAITDPFREPECPWCPGNRGIEYATRRGAPVRAVATGRVTFAGSVAGTVYVIVRHADGRRVTYGNLIAAEFDRGDIVVGGHLVGAAAGRFHLGLRDGETYVDPAPYIGWLRFRPRLVPLDGSSPNPAPTPRLTCARP